MAEPLQDQRLPLAFPRFNPKLASKQDLSHVWHPCNHIMAWAVAKGVNDSFLHQFSHNKYAEAIICLYIWPNILWYDIAATSKVPPPANYVAPDMLQVVLGMGFWMQKLGFEIEASKSTLVYIHIISKVEDIVCLRHAYRTCYIYKKRVNKDKCQVSSWMEVWEETRRKGVRVFHLYQWQSWHANEFVAGLGDRYS